MKDDVQNSQAGENRSLRQTLRAILDEGEQNVPSTTANIMASIRQEGQNAPKEVVHKDTNTTPFPVALPQIEKPYPKRSRRTLYNILAVSAVAAVLIASFGLFSNVLRSTSYNSASTSSGSGATTGNGPVNDITRNPSSIPAATAASTVTSSFDGWNAAALAFNDTSNTNQWFIANSNYLNGHTAILTQYVIRQPQFDGIAPNGKELMYRTPDSGHVLYYTALTRTPKTGFFIELNSDDAGNAIWMPDSRHVLVLARHSGIIEVDTQTGQSNTVQTFPLQNNVLSIEQLVFYRDGYVYFIGTPGGNCGDSLCRVGINTSDKSVQSFSPRENNSTFWLSPDGDMIYFRHTGPVGQSGIYAVNIKNQHSQILDLDGWPIGFASDNSLMIMRNSTGKFQIVKVGATRQQDQIVFADAAPGAASLCPKNTDANPDDICDYNIALAPYGHAAIVQATYSDGTHKLWSDDLVTKEQFIMRTQSSRATPARLLGWDRLPA